LLGPGCLTEKGGEVGRGSSGAIRSFGATTPPPHPTPHHCIYREYGTNECFPIYRIGWCLYCILAVVKIMMIVAVLPMITMMGILEKKKERLKLFIYCASCLSNNR
jgi:hypothetical protein